MIFIIILIILLVLIYLLNIKKYNENFISCSRVPSGPYKTKCTNIELNNNILTALCIKDRSENTFEFTKLNLTDCIKDPNDCDSINADSQGKLICE